MKNKFKVILFNDIKGSSRLWQKIDNPKFN